MILNQPTALNLTALRLTNSVPFLALLASLNLFLIHNGFSYLSASNDIGIFFAVYFLISIISGKLIEYISPKQFYLCTNLLQSFALILMGLDQDLLLLSLALFLSSMAIQQVMVVNMMNQLTNHDHFARRRLMMWAYAATNLAGLLSTVLAFILFHYQLPQVLYLIAALFPILSNRLYRAITREDETHSTKQRFGYPVLIGAVLLLTLVLFYLFHHHDLADVVLIALFASGIAYFLYLGLRSAELTLKPFRLLLFLFYYATACLFFSLLYLNITLLYDFIPKVTHVQYAQVFTLFDPLTALLFFPLVRLLVRFLRHTPLADYITLLLFAVALLLALLATLLMSHLYQTTMNDRIVVLIFYVMLLTFGEIFISPEGFSLAGRLLSSDLTFYGVALWRTSIGISFLLATLWMDHLLHGPMIREAMAFYRHAADTLIGFIVMFMLVTVMLEHRLR